MRVSVPLSLSIPLLLIQLILLLSRASPSTCGDVDNPQDPEKLVDKNLIATYRMANFFLNDIIQTRVLTDIVKNINITTTKQFVDSLSDQWEDWIIYMIGFTVCAGIGAVLFIVWLLAAFIFPCCRRCGHCGGGKSAESKRSSRCCVYGCSVALVVMTIGLMLGVVPLFMINESIYSVAKNDVFNDIDDGFDSINKFLNQSVTDINNTVYVGYIQTEVQLFQVLDNMQADLFQTIDETTGVVTTVNQLTAFSNQLLPLQTDLTQSIADAYALEVQMNTLSKNLDALQRNISGSYGKCGGSTCIEAFDMINSTSVNISFQPVIAGLTAASLAVNATVNSDFIELVDNLTVELTKINSSLDNSINGPVEDIKNKSKEAEGKTLEFVNTVDDEVIKINVQLSDYQAKVSKLSENSTYNMVLDIIYWSLIGLFSVILAIVAFNLVGIIFGVVLSPKPSAAKGCCGFDRSLGSHFLMASVALTFIFYWFYALSVMLLFVSAGSVHTEFCRHAVNIKQTRSAGVLNIFDGWIDEKLPDIGFDGAKLNPFSIMRECLKNESLYTAIDAESFWNITELLDEYTGNIDSASEELKEVQLNPITVNLTNPELLGLLDHLNDVFYENGTGDFSSLIASISVEVTAPYTLAQLADQIANIDENELFDRSYQSFIITELLELNETATKVQTGRDALVAQMLLEQAAMNSISFSDAKDDLISSQEMINANSTIIMSQFVNETADNIYVIAVSFAVDTAESINHDVAKCYDLYHGYETVIDSVCVKVLYPTNGLWYSLGWCLAFFIPHLFLAVHLAAVFGRPRSIDGTGSSSSVRHMDDAFTGGDVTTSMMMSTESVSGTKDSTASELELKTLFYDDLRKATESRATSKSYGGEVDKVGTASPSDLVLPDVDYI